MVHLRDDQTVYLQVNSTSANEIEDYRVGVQALDRPGDDVADTVAEATPLEIGDEFNGEILIRGDKDMFRVELEGGKDYVFRVNGVGTGEGTMEDPRSTRTGDNGSILVRSDADSGWCISLIYKPEADGVYYLTVTSDAPTEGDEISTGTYRLLTVSRTTTATPRSVRPRSRSVATRRWVGSTTTTACSVPRRYLVARPPTRYRLV